MKYVNMWGTGGQGSGDSAFSWFEGGPLEQASKKDWTKLLDIGLGSWMKEDIDE